MALEKVTYKDKVTTISAKNLNDMQDEIIANKQEIEQLKAQGGTQGAGMANATVE